MFAVTKEVLETHEALLSVEIEAETIEKAKRQAARTIAREIHIPGFRKGHAPYNRVVRYVGEAALMQETADQILKDIYPQIIDEADIQPYGPGELQDMELEPMAFKIKVPLEPSVKLGDYRSMRHEWEDVTISDDELASVLEQIREEHVMLEPVERPAAMGDEVHVDIVGTSNDEVVVEEEDIEVQLDEARPFFSSGFVDALVGLSEGEEKTFTLTVPDDFAEEDLRGADITFEVKVLHIYERQLPELDDALASTVGAFETLDELKADTLERMTEYRNDQAKQAYQSAMLNALVEQAELHYPPVMVEDTLDDIVKESDDRLEQEHQLSLEDALRLEGRTMEQFRDAMRAQAERRIANSLVLVELAQVENIEVSDDEVVLGFRDMFTSLGLDDNEKLMQDMFADLDINSELGQRIRSDIYHRKAMDRLEQIGRGEVEAMSESADAEAVVDEEPVEAVADTDAPSSVVEPASESGADDENS